ncbi:hypothetical protein Tco_0962319 [Tanacetum coccineum]
MDCKSLDAPVWVISYHWCRNYRANERIPCQIWDVLVSDEELEAPMKDRPLPADASPTTLSPGYIADSNSEEDEEDPEEDPADYPADGGDNDDNDSSNDDDDDDDVEEDDEEEKHLASTDPSAVPTDDPIPSS